MGLDPLNSSSLEQLALKGLIVNKVVTGPVYSTDRLLTALTSYLYSVLQTDTVDATEAI